MIKIYYFINELILSKNRTGIHVVTLYLAKALLKINNIELIFIKWNQSILLCNAEEIISSFNLNEMVENHITNVDIINHINYTHKNKQLDMTEGIFLCTEIISDSKLSKFLIKNNIKTIFILYDIIPMKLELYKIQKKLFSKYLHKFIFKCNKIISISKFTMNELYDYKKYNSTSILLPHQYRNTKFIKSIKNYDKIIILVPGSIEPRKQQHIIFKHFHKFVKLYPNINIQLITFGNIHHNSCCDDNYITKMTKKYKSKFVYLGIINNFILEELYKIASFTCFISYYEGFGFPIAESLWHGTPVLTANFGSMKEIGIHGGCLMVNTNNHHETYTAFESLILNPQKIIDLTNEINSDNFTTWKQYSENIYNEIKTVI